MNQIKEISIGVLYGAYDSLYGLCEIQRSYADDQTIKNKNNKIKKLFNQVILCTFLNGVLYGGLALTINFIVLNENYFLKYTIFEGKQDLGLQLWFNHFISNTYNFIWILPSLLISRMVTIFFYQINRYNIFHKRDNPSTHVNTSMMFASTATDMTFSLLIQTLFSIQALTVEIFPAVFLPNLLKTLLLSVLFSLHIFEYGWQSIGWPVNQRLQYIENNWPYFLGFGLPLTVATNLPNNYFLKACLFHILSPFFVISANVAHPRISHNVIHAPVFKLLVWLSNCIMIYIRSFRSYFSCRYCTFE